MPREFARVDKFYWTNDMLLNEFTESEKALITYFSKHNKYKKQVVDIEYSLDIACIPKIRLKMIK